MTTRVYIDTDGQCGFGTYLLLLYPYCIYSILLDQVKCSRRTAWVDGVTRATDRHGPVNEPSPHHSRSTCQIPPKDPPRIRAPVKPAGSGDSPRRLLLIDSLYPCIIPRNGKRDALIYSGHDGPWPTSDSSSPRMWFVIRKKTNFFRKLRRHW